MRTTRTIFQVGAVVIAAAAALAIASPAGAEVLTPNLLQNPGAETRSGSGAGQVVTTIPYWTRGPVFGSNRSTIVDYGAPGFPTVAQAASLDGGGRFFAGGPSAGSDDNSSAFSEALIGQDIEIPPNLMALVRSEGAQATISACLGGYANQNDRVDMAFFTFGVDYGIDRAIGSESIVGPGAADRANKTGLLPVTFTVGLRPDSTTLGIRLDFIRASGADTFNDGYADNISVRISTVGTTPPAPHCSPDLAPGPGGSTPSPGTPNAGKPDPFAGSSSLGGTNSAAALARVGKHIKVSGATAKLKLRCVARDTPCKGSVSLRTKLGKLGSAKFSIPAGDIGTMNVKIPRQMRHRLVALPRTRLAKLKITATARIGAETTTFTFGAV
jgi:hypothetical protein